MDFGKRFQSLNKGIYLNKNKKKHGYLLTFCYDDMVKVLLIGISCDESLVTTVGKRVTIKDVAEAAELSITAVSQILNGKGERFPKATRDRVMAVRDKLGYVPNFNARSMINHSMKTVGIIVPNLVNPFFSTFLRGIQSAMYESECVPIILSADHNETLERYYLKTFIERGVDGVIIAGSAIGNKGIKDLLQPIHISYLLFDQADPISGGDQIIVNDEHGGELATSHLIQAGHRKIAVVIPEQPSQNVKLRLAGYRHTLEQNQIPFDPKLIFPTGLSKMGGRQIAADIIKSKVTAVFSTNDEMAIGLIRGLQEANVRVPEDVSVIGYDDIDLDDYVTPRLTTIHQPIYDMGVWAGQMIMSRLNTPELSPQLKMVDVSLKERNSVKRL